MEKQREGEMATTADNLPILRTSERSAFKKCPQKWWWEYRDGLTPKVVQADSRWFGIGIHIALAEWYQRGTRRGPHPADVFAEWVGDEISWLKTYQTESYDEPKWEEARELGISMLEGYVDYWGRDPQWYIISIEQPFKVRLSLKGKPVALFASRWDGVFRDLRSGLIYLLENKTASQIWTAYLEGDEQAGSYLAVASRVLRAKGVLKAGEEIAGIQYNFLRKAMADERPQNEQGLYLNKDNSVSKKQPAPRFVRPEPIERSQREQARQLERIAEEVSVMNLVKSGDLPVIKTRTRDCPFCDFWVMCQLHERGGDSWKEIMKADFTVHDPYQDIRQGDPIKSASE